MGAYELNGSVKFIEKERTLTHLKMEHCKIVSEPVTELFEHNVCFEITAAINSEPVLRNLKIEEKRYGVWRKRGAEEHSAREAVFLEGTNTVAK